jgi:hypothetical protein
MEHHLAPAVIAGSGVLMIVFAIMFVIDALQTLL